MSQRPYNKPANRPLHLRLHERAETIGPRAQEEARRTHSWLYWAVVETKQVRVLGAICLILFLAPLLYLLLAVNPRLGLGKGWNTIDHVSDIRPAHDYTAAEISAMAGSENWLALATADDGLTLINKNSRVPRDRFVKEPVLDVTRGWSRDDFLVLQADQAIVRVNAGGLGSIVTKPTWLEGPENPALPITPATGMLDIVANAQDPDGWLVAVRGGGIARYQFETTTDGQLIRTRSWQTGDSASLSLDQAIITSGGIWYTLQGGGIGYAARDTLNQLSARSVSTPPLLRLDADATGQWASAVDQQGGLWIYPGESTGWLGPYFGGGTQECQVQSLADVETARLEGNLAWLGSGSGLLAHDAANRRIECVASNLQVVDLALPGSGSDSGGLGWALVASRQGLYLASRQAPQDGYNVSTMDYRAVESMSLSPDSSLLVYQTRASVWPTGSQTETLAWLDPLTGVTSTVLSPDTGWRDLASAPVVVGIEPLGSDLAFGTSEGAFTYNLQEHRYEDLSTSLLQWDHSSREVQLATFTDMHQDEEDLLAIADGSPQILQTGSDGERIWLSLDPDRRTEPTQIVQASGSLVGLGPEGLLYSYQYTPSLELASYLTGRAQSLALAPPLANQAVGDLLVFDDDRWSTSFINGDALVRYESRTGRMSETRLPSQIGDADNVAQMRLVDGFPTYLLADGSVLDEEGEVRLGYGSLPFEPSQATAIAPAQDGTSLLVGGPEGNVVQYEWPTGSAYLLGEEAIWDADAAVVEIQDTDRGCFVRLSDGRLFYSGGVGWNELPGYRRWATDSAGKTVGLVGDAGFEVVYPTWHWSDWRWGYEVYSRDDGMKAFVDQARFAWPLSPSRVAFFGSGSEIGIYDRDSDIWRTKEAGALWDPRQFASNAESVVALDGQRLVRIDTNFRPDVLEVLPSDASSPSLHLDGDGHLQVAFVQQGAAVLWTWDNISGYVVSPTEYWRGGASMPAGFDPSRVVYAFGQYGSLQLWDHLGNAAIYYPETGTWDQLRRAKPGESVYGWLTVPAGQPADMLLDTGQGSLQLVFSDDWSYGEFDVPIGPEALESLMSLAVRPCDNWRWPRGFDCHCLPSVWAQKFLAHLDLRVAPIGHPSDGTLLQDGLIRVERTGGHTSYQIQVAGEWRSLHIDAEGFAEDRVAGTVLSASGALWALQGQELVRFERAPAGSGLLPGESTVALPREPTLIERLPSAQIGVHYADGVPDYLTESQALDLEPAPAIQSQVLAAMDLAGHELVWTWHLDQHLTTSWRDESLAVWSATGDGLALQRLHDVALAADGSYLLASELGVIVRKASDYSLLAIYQDLQEARFVYTEGPRKLWIVAGGSLFEWRDGSPIPVSQPAGVTSSIVSGPWLWQVQPLGDTPQDVRITHNDDGHARRWTQIDSQTWRFNDDIVSRIARDLATGQAWLDTEDGYWPYSHIGGRETASGPTPDLSSDDVTVRTAAIQVQYSAANVTFSPADRADLPAFEGGRFFFDNSTQIVSCDGALCALVPGRGIVRRDPTRLGTLTGFWTLPASILPDVVPRLSASPGSLRLEVEVPWRTESQAWEMELGDSSDRWVETQVREDSVVAAAQFVQWRPVPEAGLEPFLAVRGQGLPQELSGWWQGDRFAWDQVACAGALDHGTAVLATAAGPIIWQAAEDGSFNGTALGPVAEMNTCFTARQDGRSVGLVVVAADGVQSLISVDDQGEPAVEFSQADRFSPSRAILTLGRVDTASGGYIGLQESWPMCESGETCAGGAIQAELPGFPEGVLLKDGQFIFDRADGASPLGGGDGASWLTYTRCDGDASSGCVIAFSTLERDEATGQSRLVLRDFWRPMADLAALRPAPEGGAFGYYFDGDTGTGASGVAWLRLEGDDLNRYPVETLQTADAFREGDTVTLELPALHWTSAPAYVWSEAPSFAVSPAGYPLFARQSSGVSLAFDVITSLTGDQATGQLAIGTEGGVFIVPLADDVTPFLSLSNQRQRFTFNGAADLGQWVLDVQRLRHDENGRLWAKLGALGRAAVLEEGTTWQIRDGAWPAAWSRVGDVAIHIGEAGFSAHDTEYTASNDLLKWTRRPMAEVVDFSLDDRSQTLWLATRHDGVFKVLLEHLPR